LKNWQEVTENSLFYELKEKMLAVHHILDQKYDRQELESKLVCKADKSRLRELE
jgi:hypothetical protein